MTPKAKQLSPRAAAIAGMKDPVERAAAAQEFLEDGRDAIKQMERLRDDAIREARKAGRGTIDDLAEAVNVKRNVVVNALRGAK